MEDSQPNVEELAEVVQQMLYDDRPRDQLFERIDDAVDVKFDPDPAVKKLPWVRNRHYAMTDIADARNTGVRTFSTLMPTIEISPLNDEAAEYERTNMAEQALTWEFERMNRNGKKSIHDAILEDAMSYHAVAFQTEYLPFRFKNMEKNGRTRAMLRQRSYNWIRHHPKTVHARWSDDLLESVVKVANYSVQELIEKFGRDNTGIARLLMDNSQITPVQKLTTWYTLIDWTDWDNRVIWAVPAGIAAADAKLPLANQLSATLSQYVMMNEKHGLPFIPWVVIDKGNPIWEAVLKSGMWDNLQYMNLIRFAKAIEQSTRSTLIIKTPDGTLRNVWVDFSNPSNPIVTSLDGTVIENLNPAPLDPGLETQFQDVEGKIASSTVSHVLRDITRFSNAPFATVNQMVTMALSQLSRAKNAGAEAEAAGFIQMFEWIDHSKIPLNAYRPSGRDSKMDETYRDKGGQITIMPGSAPTEKEIQKMSDQEYQRLMKNTVYFDLSALYIKVELQANSSTDEQSRLNVNINAVDKLGMSKEMAWERMGWRSFKLANTQRIQEVLLEAELQNEVMRNNQQVIDEIRQQVMKQMQDAQSQIQPGGGGGGGMQQQSQGMGEMNGGQQPTMQGVDNRTGGNPMAMANPGATREALSGQASNGGQVMQ